MKTHYQNVVAGTGVRCGHRPTPACATINKMEVTCQRCLALLFPKRVPSPDVEKKRDEFLANHGGHGDDVCTCSVCTAIHEKRSREIAMYDVAIGMGHSDAHALMLLQKNLHKLAGRMGPDDLKRADRVLSLIADRLYSHRRYGSTWTVGYAKEDN